MNIALIGMMGTMKSSAGRELARRLGMQFFDTDGEICKEEKMTVSEIFASRGEEYFRARETEVLSRLCGQGHAVISCGGGTPIKKENRELLKSCTAVLLTASAATIAARLKNDTTRPLLGGDASIEKIAQLQAAREDIYLDAADIIIATDGKTSVQVAAEIIQKTGI